MQHARFPTYTRPHAHKFPTAPYPLPHRSLHPSAITPRIHTPTHPHTPAIPPLLLFHPHPHLPSPTPPRPIQPPAISTPIYSHPHLAQMCGSLVGLFFVSMRTDIRTTEADYSKHPVKSGLRPTLVTAAKAQSITSSQNWDRRQPLKLIAQSTLTTNCTIV